VTALLVTALAAAFAAAQEPSAAEEVVRAAHPETLLDFALAGGWLMVPIGLSSVLLVAFLIERLVSTRRGKVVPRALVQAARALTDEKRLDRDRAAAACDSHPSAAARVLRTAIERLDAPAEELEQAVTIAARREVFALRRYTRVFVIIAGVAPLLGLLGTVTGMIQSFREVAIQGLGSGQALAPGIYQALITTAAGLVVAIPAILSYHWIMSRIDDYTNAMDTLVVDVVERGRAGKEAP
jgi:biopolymer transport protein ExbB